MNRPRTIAALTLFAAIGPLGAQTPSLKDLRKQLGDRDTAVRLAAASALKELGTDAAPAAPQLADRLGDDDAGVRNAAADALAVCGPKAVRYIRTALGDGERQLGAIRAVGQLGDAAVPLLPLVTKLWRAEDLALRAAIGECLVELAPRSVPHLIECLPNQMSGIYAAEALGKIGPTARDAVPALIEFARHRARLGKDNAVQALGEIGDERAVPVFAELLDRATDVDSYTASIAAAAADACRTFGPGAADAVPALVRFVSNDVMAKMPDDPRWHGVNALESIGLVTPDVIAALRAHTSRSDGLGDSARRTLATLAPDSTVPEDQLVMLARRHRSPAVRIAAATELAARPPAPTTSAALARVVTDADDRNVKLAAIVGLGDQGAVARPHEGVLKQLATGDDAELADAAAAALTRIGG